MFDNIKAQTHSSLSKLLHTVKTRNSEQNQTHSRSEFIEMHGQNLSPNEKILISMLFTSSMDKTMSETEFVEELQKTLYSLGIEENQFKIEQKKKQIINPFNKTLRIGKETKKQSSFQIKPQYYRIDSELCHRLFHIYKKSLHFPENGLKMSFEEREHYESCMSYHKILEMLKEAQIHLEIHQKLQILRNIKKHCIHKNFITYEEFVKVYKVLVHGMGYKEQIFYPLTQKKALEMKIPKQPKRHGSKDLRSLKFKTQASLLQKSQPSALLPLGRIQNYSKKLHTQISQTQAEHRKLSEIKHKSRPQPRQASEKSYLSRAMKSDKVRKITWETLFQMNQTNMHHNIVIPDIVRKN